MLGLLLIQVLAASQSCEERCAANIDKCYSGCGSMQKCMRRCDDDSASCNAACSADAERARPAPSLPCGARPSKGGGDDQLRPCTEDEAKVFKDALKSKELKQALKCKDKAGNPTPCKEDKAKVEALAREIGGEKALCKDENGRPAVCADAQKKVEARVKGGGGNSKTIDVQ